jgi:hypothetical protein
MNGWIVGCLFVFLMYVFFDVCMVVLIVGWMDGLMDGWMYGWMDG